GPISSLGLPTSEAIQVSPGVYRQTFEGAAIQYTSSTPPLILLPVAAVRIGGAPASGTVSLNLGQATTLTATPVDASGKALTDRPVWWSPSNGKGVSIQAAGTTAVITAVGGGSASVTAASQGTASSKINFVVVAPCCQVGEGAPSSVQQSFQD